jgi:hypothetical protein
MIEVTIREEKHKVTIAQGKLEVLPRVGELLDIYWKLYVVTDIKHYLGEQLSQDICIFVKEL